ncbi:hypothetical protein [Burkholderia sp. AU45388]|uniref:hypothetical protein n=1 Tax=Burkholderia sp. AU45388 TaxID=3059206 RepID=UPI00264A940B|nr:hypothetical protein [Burkholderia sp. AU45388]MDN7429252.1 hypothetical protein [Burkholderia sp. AU45388]
MSTTDAAIPGTRRYTTIRVIAYHGILQNVTALLAFVPFARFILHDRSMAALPSWSWQLWALQGVSFAAMLAGLIGYVALALRRRWGRTLNVAVWIALSAAMLMLSSWIAVVIALPLGLATFALIYNRTSNDFLSLPHATTAPTARRFAFVGLLVASSTLHYWAIAYATMRTGTFGYVLPNTPPMDLLIAAAATLLLGTAVAPRGQRAWYCGMSLMTSAIAMLSMLLSYVPVATSLIRYMPHEYSRVAIPWSPITQYAALTFCVALVSIRVTKPPKRSDWEQGLHPDASAESTRRETTR